MCFKKKNPSKDGLKGGNLYGQWLEKRYHAHSDDPSWKIAYGEGCQATTIESNQRYLLSMFFWTKKNLEFPASLKKLEVWF